MEDANPHLLFSYNEALACQADIEAAIGSSLPNMIPEDKFCLHMGLREGTPFQPELDAYKRCIEKLRLMRDRRLAVVARDIGPDLILEVRLYMDAWVELWDCTYEVYGVKPHCFQSYRHGSPLPTAEEMNQAE